jgi:hypothetical protein
MSAELRALVVEFDKIDTRGFPPRVHPAAQGQPRSAGSIARLLV